MSKGLKDRFYDRKCMKSADSRLAKARKAEFTDVNEHLRAERNAEDAFSGTFGYFCANLIIYCP